MGVYIYYTVEEVPFEILNTIGLKTGNCSVEEFVFAIDIWRPTMLI